jgi:hypothetical protein
LKTFHIFLFFEGKKWTPSTKGGGREVLKKIRNSPDRLISIIPADNLPRPQKTPPPEKSFPDDVPIL